MPLLLRVAYDGTAFHGSARQLAPDGSDRVRTVQGALQAALRELYGQDVPTTLASRTDAGVHAEGQLAAIEPPLEIPPDGVVRALGGMLPSDVVVREAWSEEGVHVRHDNLGKRYVYRIRCAEVRDALQGRFEWHLGRPLDVAAMARAGERLLGEHDFAGFRAANCQARTTVRRLHEVRVEAGGDEDDAAAWGPRLAGSRVRVVVVGSAFLKNMVRILVGSLVDVGLGRRAPEDVARPLVTRDRRHAGPTAPARGLCLEEVLWPTRAGRVTASSGRPPPAGRAGPGDPGAGR